MWQIITNNWGSFLTGFWNTILSSIIALVFSLILGVIFALLEVAPSKFGQVIAKIYIAIFRNIPLLVIVMIFYLIVPRYIVKLSGFQAGTIGLTLYTSAFIAETVRAGINSIGTGQMEGARSNGMTYVQAMRYVILPQAMKIVIPPLGNQFVNLVKNSSVLAFVAGFDLMYQAQLIAFSTFQTIDTYIIVTRGAS
ncbi:amino acid ABC transporter permease [Lactobacillus crispatus]|uniref:amino acid ABC transporter permease n=1 Tax=Lactobacillus crispatus TaxID=47770 RepID=UPI0027E3EBBD|nr:amino acid ABC transporter permease [Lactobacillus crispatus]